MIRLGRGAPLYSQILGKNGKDSQRQNTLAYFYIDDLLVGKSA